MEQEKAKEKSVMTAAERRGWNMKEKMESLIRGTVKNAFELYDVPDHAADSAAVWVMTGIAKEIEEMEKSSDKKNDREGWGG